MAEHDKGAPEEAFAELLDRRTRKQFLQAAAALGLTASIGARGALAAGDRFSAVGAGPPQLRKHHTFLHSAYTLNNAYFSSLNAGAVEAGKAFNDKIVLEVNNFNLSLQKSQLENAPSQGIEGVMMIPNTDASAPDLIRVLTNAKIWVTADHLSAPWVTPPDISPYYVGYQVNNNVAAMYAQTVNAFKKLGGKGNVIYIQGIPGATQEIERTIGYNRALKQFPGIKELARQPGGWSRTTTAPIIRDLLTAHPNVDAVICSNDDEAVAVVAALEEAKIKALVTGFDGIKDYLDLIADGRAFSTFAFHGAWLGGYNIAQLFDAVNGYKPSVPERMMFFSGFVLDTAPAAKLYRKLFFEDKSAPYDWLKMSKVLHPKDWNPGNLMKPIDPIPYWEQRNAPRPKHYRLPKQYAQAKSSGEFARVAALYEKRFTKDPLAGVLALTTTKRTII